jgi:hypothetical protein
MRMRHRMLQNQVNKAVHAVHVVEDALVDAVACQREHVIAHIAQNVRVQCPIVVNSVSSPSFV